MQPADIKEDKTDKATIAKLKNSLQEWKDALSTMIAIAFECAMERKKPRTVQDIKNLAKRSCKKLSDTHIMELRKALPDGHVMRKDNPDGIANNVEE